MNQIFSAFMSALVSYKPARSAVPTVFTLAALLNVTSTHQVFAKQPEPAVTVTAAGMEASKAGDQDQGDDDDDDDDDAAFKQPVRAGDLIGRDVIAPIESQNLLGHVIRVIRRDGDVTIVMTYGGTFGVGGHPVCVAADALALTGYTLQAKDIGISELDKLPACDGSGDTAVDPNASIQMKLAKPAH